MTETLPVLEAAAPRLNDAPAAPAMPRNEVQNLLRDVAFVLAQTQRIRAEMLQDKAPSESLQPCK